MNRRIFLTGVGVSLAALLTGCIGGTGAEDENPSTEDGETAGGEGETGGGDGQTVGEGGQTGGEDCKGNLETSDDDSVERFLKKNETPESAGAQKLLATVEKETEGLAQFTDDNDTERIGLSEKGDTWEIKYYGNPVAGEVRFRKEIAELATTFALNQPEGISLKATSLHECTTGTWHVCAETAVAYQRGELDRKTFVDRVSDSAKIVNNC